MKPDDFDLMVKLKEACDKGETAIVQLMDLLKNQFIKIATAYKDCLNKLIEIFDAASKATSKKLDELPQYKTLAKDLEQQFQSFIITINTLGELAANETIEYIADKKQFQLLKEKHKELNTLVTKEVEEIKKLEARVLAKGEKAQ